MLTTPLFQPKKQPKVAVLDKTDFWRKTQKPQKMDPKNVFFSKGPEFWTFETSSTSNCFFCPGHWDINFVLKCLPAHCDMFRVWASHNCLFWTPTKLSQWVMHFVPIFLSDHEFFRRTSQKLSLWWVDLLSVILNLTNNALDDVRVNFFGRQLIGRKTSYSGQKNDFIAQDFSVAGGIIEPSWKSSVARPDWMFQARL